MEQSINIATSAIQDEPIEQLFDESDNRCMDAIHEMEEWDIDTPWEEFNAQFDCWARHALASNGFGGH